MVVLKKDTADKAGKDGNKKLVVGASAVPHAEILEAAKPLLKEKGIELEIKVFTRLYFTKHCFRG